MAEVANRIDRRLSFGTSKTGIAMDKYLNFLDECKASEFNFLKLSEGVDVHTEQELADLKEYFSKLKFCYMELYTKQKLMTALLQDRSEWPTADENQDKRESEHKANFKQLQAKGAAITKETTDVIRELVAGYEKFKHNKDKLVSELESAKKMIRLLDEEDTTNIDSQQRASNDTATVKPLSTQTWEEQLTKQTISALSGMEVVSIEEDQITIRINHANTEHTLEVYFKPDTAIIDDLKLIPEDIPYEDIGGYAKQFNDFGFLVRELRARIVNFSRRHNEMETLKKDNRYLINYDSSSSTVTVTFRSGLIVTIELEMDYPQPYAGLTVIRMDAPAELSKQLEVYKNELNKMSSCSLSQLIARIDERS